MIKELTAAVRQPVQYIWQANLGAAGARNTGLDRAGGKYIAFFDSDDLWLPHHLQDCVESLDANADVDWVYGACRIVDGDSGQVLEDTTFYIDGRPRPFMNLSTRVSGQLRIIVDRNTVKTILAGDRLRCGLQNSVFRRRVFDVLRFPPFQYVEDRVFTVVALLKHVCIGYLDDVHVIYRVHEGNVSLAARGMSVEKCVRSCES